PYFRMTSTGMQSPSRLMNFSPKGIGQLLSEDRLIVPPNQRAYAWEEDQVEDLIHDFAGSMDSDTGLHFLGFIILTTGDTQTEHPEISDGQQRLATTTMLLAALRDYLLDMEEQDDAASIERDFLIKRDRSQGEDRPRLIMNIDDQAFFESTVLLPPKKRKLR